ncbi:MFS transporter [Stygiolobus caldivivus]|uniref:MFS transporter n=1 Tax=Stygiolobus caldivivus TaxID=2824673 RepID=A0A8D5ZH65_9CREN|nr:MFS transporter [Stygiolobus caldivivus]BCU71563.1 MFS transporter [Stygiolobus caldivivus]
MKPLRTYIMLKNFALSLTQPFIAFLSALSGVNGEALAIISSAGTVLPSIVQFLLGFMRAKGKQLVVLGSAIVGGLWIILSLIPFGSVVFVVFYVLLEAGLGISLFGWYLIMDKVSTSSRGRVLAQYSFYSTLGGLIATLITGFFVGDDKALIRPFFMTTGLLMVTDSYIAYKFDVDYERPPLKGLRVSRELRDFLVVTFAFNVIWSSAWPIFPLAQVYVFNMNFENIAIIDTISGVSTLLMQNWVGRLVDKNRKMVMFTGRLALATFPLAYALSSSVYEIYLANVIAGFTNSVNSTAYLSYLYDSSKDTRKSIGLYNVITALGDLTGSSIGGITAEIVTNTFGLVRGIREMMLAIALLRVIASLFYLKLHEPIKA